MKQTRDARTFFQYVIPSVLSFALSGVYTIVDGFFVGNSIGDLGLSAVNIAYPIVAVIQALGTGIGMGGAIYYSIYKAEKKEESTLVMAKVNEFVNMRQEADQDAEKIGVLYKDCGGEIVEQIAGWTKVKSGEVTGWIKNDYLYFYIFLLNYVLHHLKYPQFHLFSHLK